MSSLSFPSLKSISYQNHFASIKLQKVFRGHSTRLDLWKYGGILMVSRVVKVQKCWRGLLGRRVAAAVYNQKVLAAAHKIQGLYYRWHSRRLRLRAHLNFLNRGVVLLQSYFRMRAAIQFSNVIRRLLHNKRALRIQCQVRRWIGKRRCQERRMRLAFVHKQLMGYVRESIQQNRASFSSKPDDPASDTISVISHTNSEDVGDRIPADSDRREDDLVVAFNKAMCTLVALARYEAVKHLTTQMNLASTIIYKHNLANMDSTTPATDLACAGPAEVPRGVSLTATYLALSASWSRSGRRRQTKLEHMEEALGLMMQHSAVALVSVQQHLHSQRHPVRQQEPDEPSELLTVSTTSNEGSARSKNQQLERSGSSISGLDFDPQDDAYGGLPSWFLHLDEATIDMYYMCALRMQSVCSPYDTLLLLADWVWYQACLLEHNQAAANMVNEYTSYVNTARSSLSEQTSRPPSAAEALPVGTPEGHSNHIVEEDEGALQRNRAIRRVHRLLHRARKLLSADSRDMREVTDRIDLFHDLHMTEHRSLLLDLKNFLFPYRGHYYTQQELNDRQRAASREASSAKLSRIQARMKNNSVKINDSAVEDKEPVGNDARNLGVDLQIILCGRTILIKGSVPLHRLVETSDDLPRNSCLTGGPTRPSTSSTINTLTGNISSRTPPGALSQENNYPEQMPMDASWDAFFQQESSGRPAPVMVAVRPLVLMRAEVKELVEQMNRELGLEEAMQAENAAAEKNKSVKIVNTQPDTGRSYSTTTSRMSGSVDTRSFSEVEVKPTIDYQDALKKKRRHAGGGHTLGEYARLTEYLKTNLRVVSCQERYSDPALLKIATEMREYARGNKKYPSKYAFARSEEAAMLPSEIPVDDVIFPGVPSVRFSLPVVEYRRRVENEGQNVVHATFLLQRVFRGYQGRAKFRRMHWKRAQYSEQQRRTAHIRAEHDAVRRWRGERLTLIQRLFRGFRWRKRLHALKVASLQVQCAFRIFRAKRIVNAERRRRIEGAAVVSMLGQGRGVTLGEFSFTLKIYRSGTNYRLEGLDMLRGAVYDGAVYDGAVYTPEVLRLIQTHNATITGTSVYANSQRIMPWQHERVVELIIANLGLMAATQAVTTQLGGRSGGQAKYMLVTSATANPHAPPLHALPTQYQLHSSVSAPVLEQATAHTAKLRLQRHAEHRQNIRYRGKPPK